MKKYWSIPFLALLVLSFAWTKKYEVVKDRGIITLTEPIWVYWIHCQTSEVR